MRLRNGKEANDRQVRAAYAILQKMSKGDRLIALRVAKRFEAPNEVTESAGLSFEGSMPQAVRDTIVSAVLTSGTLQTPWE